MRTISTVGCAVLMVLPTLAQAAEEISLTLAAKPEPLLSDSRTGVVTKERGFVLLEVARANAIKDSFDGAYHVNVREYGYPIRRLDAPGPAYRELRGDSKTLSD